MERDWRNANLPGIWSLIEGENNCTGADRVLDWQNLADAVRDQRRELLAKTAELADVWPPESNNSAQRFIAQIDALAASMQRTLDDAQRTKDGLNGVIDAINTAKMTIQPLIAERAEVADDLTPRLIDEAEDKYDARAQQAMAEAEASVAEASAKIQAPALYEMRPAVEQEETKLPVGGGSGATAGGSRGAGASGLEAPLLRATPIPVPVPNDPPAWMTKPEQPPASSPTADGSQSSRSGLDLAGIAPTPIPGTLPAGGTGLISAPVPSGASLPLGAPSMPGMVIGAPGLTPGASTGGVAGRADATRSGLRAGGAGGVGTYPGAMANAAGRGAVAMRRGLPSGAVIGSSDLSGARGGRGGGTAGHHPFAGIPGQRAPRPGTSDGDHLIGGEADQRWHTDTGVDPVITPDTTTPNHDPGPGVIGQRP